MKNTAIFKPAVTTVLTLFFISEIAFGQIPSGNVKGKITTSDGKAAAYVSVMIDKLNKGTVTNEDGEYIIRKIPAGTWTLKVSSVGVNPQESTVSVNENETVNADFHLDQNAHQLQEIVINTQRQSAVNSVDVAKIPLSNLENSQVYSTVTSSLMKEQGLYNLDDALRNVPGISQLWAATDRAGFGNGSSFALRGFQLNTYLRNGIPANISTTIDNANLESIEVLKGPSATLFGSAVTSYGGLINRVTKKPYDSFGGEIAYTGGSYGFNRLTADINTPLDSAKKLLFRINTALNTKKSWQDAGFHNDIFIAPSILYKANDRLTFSFDAELYESRGTTPQIFFFNTTVANLGVSSADKLNLDYKRSYMSNDLAMNSSNFNFTGKMEYKLSRGWTSQTNIAIANTNSYGPMPYFYLLGGNDSVSRNVWTIDGNDKSIDIQQNFIGEFNVGSVRNRLLLGVDYYNYDDNVRYHEFMGTAGGQTAADLFDIINTTGTIPNYYNFNKAKVDSAYVNGPADPYPYIINDKEYITAAYASDVINITDRLIINAALRLDHFKYAGSYDPQTGTTSGAYSQTSLSPKFGLIYQIVKNQVSLFGNYQNGFTNETGKDFSGHNFKPEQADQWEGGIKVNTLDNVISGTVSYYDIKVKDILRSDPDHANFEIQNGTQLSKGLEADLRINPIPEVNIALGYAYNKSKYTNADADVNGLRPNSSGPENMANFWLSYHILKGKAKGLGFGFGGNYSGKSLAESSVSIGQFYMPEYTLLNASVFYETKKLRLGVSVDNLTNKKYWIGWYTVNPQQPRSINGSIAFKF